MRPDLVAKFFDREDGFISPVARNEIFGLQLSPATGREVHAEMRQPFIPGAGDTHLFSAIFRRVVSQRMELSGRELRAVKFRREFE